MDQAQCRVANPGQGYRGNNATAEAWLTGEVPMAARFVTGTTVCALCFAK